MAFPDGAQVTGRRSTRTAGEAGSSTKGKCCTNSAAAVKTVTMRTTATNMIQIESELLLFSFHKPQLHLYESEEEWYNKSSIDFPKFAFH